MKGDDRIPVVEPLKICRFVERFVRRQPIEIDIELGESSFAVVIPIHRRSSKTGTIDPNHTSVPRGKGGTIAMRFCRRDAIGWDSQTLNCCISARIPTKAVLHIRARTQAYKLVQTVFILMASGCG